MNKKEFLKALENELISLEASDITNIIEYYDELIEDGKESGKKEKDIINDISIYEITKEVRAHKRIDEAVKKPTLSNSVKALIAFLGILSIPMLISVGAVIFSLFIGAVAIAFALIVTFGAVVFAGGASVVAIIGAIIIGKLPFSTGIFGIGLAIFLAGIFSIVLKWTISLSKELIVTIADFLKHQLNKRKGVKNNE